MRAGMLFEAFSVFYEEYNTTKKLKGVDMEKSAVFKELTPGQGEGGETTNKIKDKQIPRTVLQKLSPKTMTSPLKEDTELRG